MDVRSIDGSFSVSPQIAPDDVAVLQEAGFALVINNRPDGEEAGQPTAADIEAAARAAGIDYRAIPVSGGFSPAQAGEMAEAIANAKGPVLAFCRTGTRSTLLWALAQAGQGNDPEEIASAAARAGYDIAPVRTAVEALAATS